LQGQLNHNSADKSMNATFTNEIKLILKHTIVQPQEYNLLLLNTLNPLYN